MSRCGKLQIVGWSWSRRKSPPFDPLRAGFLATDARTGARPLVNGVAQLMVSNLPNGKNRIKWAVFERYAVQSEDGEAGGAGG
jgi:hypothetical protein